ncbi:hypothetical protein [Spirosoma telluris]
MKYKSIKSIGISVVAMLTIHLAQAQQVGPSVARPSLAAPARSSRSTYNR